MTLVSRIQQALLGSELPVPSDVPESSVPEGVRLREGRLIPAVGGLFARMGGPAAAVTLGRTIIVHPSARLSSRLLKHELAHVRQWSGDPLFPLRYTLETLRRGYWENRYECEAREAEHE